MFNIRKIILIYLYGFLLLDSLMGVLLKRIYSERLFLNPGQIIRGVILLLLLFHLLHNILFKDKINEIGKYLLILFCFFIGFLILLFFRFSSLSAIFVEISYFSKILFMLLLFYFIDENYFYYKSRFNKIININFIIFSASILIGHLSRIGFASYKNIESSKGFFYGGNPTAILSIIFFTYHLYNFRMKIMNIMFLFLALYLIYLSGSKVLFFIPVVMITFLLNKFKTKKYFGGIITGGVLSILLVIVFHSKIENQIEKIYFSRYQGKIQKNLDAYYHDRDMFSNPILRELSRTNFRRAYQADIQLNKMISNPELIIFGSGKYDQLELFETDAAMDIFDIFYQYGILGTFLIFILIFKVMFNIIRKRQIDRNSVIILLFIFYSFFGGHVIYVPTSNSLFALFLGMKYNEMNKKERLFTANRRLGKL